MKKRLVAAALALCALLNLSACSAQKQTEYKTDITVEQVASSTVTYSQESKSYAVTCIEDSLSAAITAAYGDKASSVSKKYTAYILQAIGCLEERGISEDNFLSIVEEVTSNQELIASLISQDTADVYAGVQLFSSLAKIAGTDSACLIIYDISLIVCDYHIGVYSDLYATYGYTYQYLFARQWQERKDGVQSVGEQNFLNLLKVAVSALSLHADSADSVQGLLSGFSAGEGAMYLRAQGYMMAKLTLTADDWNFVLTALSDSGYSQKAKAICSAGDGSALAQGMPQFVSDVASALTAADAQCVQAATDGDLSACLKRLMTEWTTEEWNNFASLLGGLSGDYQSYFSANGLQDDYLQFAESVTPVTLDGLINSSEEDFYQNLKGFVATYSAGFAYVVFRL